MTTKEFAELKKITTELKSQIKIAQDAVNKLHTEIHLLDIKLEASQLSS